MSETTHTPGPDDRPDEDTDGTFVGGSFGTDEEDAADPGAAPLAADVDGPDAERAEARRTDVEGVAAPVDVPPGERNEPV